jgi:hypothetical protein
MTWANLDSMGWGKTTYFDLIKTADVIPADGGEGGTCGRVLSGMRQACCPEKRIGDPAWSKTPPDTGPDGLDEIRGEKTMTEARNLTHLLFCDGPWDIPTEGLQGPT